MAGFSIASTRLPARPDRPEVHLLTVRGALGARSLVGLVAAVEGHAIGGRRVVVDVRAATGVEAQAIVSALAEHLPGTTPRVVLVGLAPKLLAVLRLLGLEVLLRLAEGVEEALELLDPPAP